MTLDKLVDAPSQKNLFGWERIGTSEDAVPVIMRNNGVRYSPVKIVEQDIIKKYDALPQSVFQCITLKSFYLTAREAQLLNSINLNHCDSRYGSTYFVTKDVIISAGDIRELIRYLNLATELFSRGLTQIGPHFGVTKVLVDPSNPNNTILVPFIEKTFHKQQTMKFVPIRLIEHFITKTATTVKAHPTDWDIMFMKMLCIYCENNLQHLISRDCAIVPIDSLLYAATRTQLIYTELARKE